MKKRAGGPAGGGVAGVHLQPISRILAGGFEGGRAAGGRLAGGWQACWSGAGKSHVMITVIE
eukprot:15480016-Alexandrium_andersonii.AAC.1